MVPRILRPCTIAEKLFFIFDKVVKIFSPLLILLLVVSAAAFAAVRVSYACVLSSKVGVMIFVIVLSNVLPSAILTFSA